MNRLQFSFVLISNAVTQGDWSNTVNAIGQFFSLFIVFVIILILAFYSTKWLAQSKYLNRSGSNLKVVEAMGIGNGGNLQIVQVGERFILLGVTKEKITFLTDIDSSQITVMKQDGSSGFEKYLSRFMKTGKASDDGDEK